MLQPYICARCTIQQRLRLHLQCLQQSRRGLSRTVPTHYRSDESYPPNARSRGTARPEETSQHPPHRRLDSFYKQGRTGIAHTEETGAKGRYSGQSLQPEQLLDQLGKAAPHRNSTVAPRGNGGPAHEGGAALRDSGPTVLPPQLNGAVKRFVSSCQAEGANDAEAWKLLQVLARFETEGGGIPPLLGKHQWFYDAYLNFTRRMCTHLCTRGGDRQTGLDQRLPKPHELLQLASTFHVETKRLWSKVPWWIATGIVEGHDSEAATKHTGLARPQSPDSQDAMVHELMTIWSMAFAAHLQRQPSSAATPSSGTKTTTPDWSCLPSPATLTGILRQQQQHDGPQTNRLTFAAVLAMLLPFSRTHNSPATAANTCDYPSSALLTLDLLRHTDTGAFGYGRAAVYADMPEYAPFVTLMEGILDAVRTPAVPQALHLRSDATWRYHERYRAAVRRLGLVDHVSRRSVEQSKKSGEPDGEATNAALRAVQSLVSDRVSKPGSEAAAEVAKETHGTSGGERTAEMLDAEDEKKSTPTLRSPVLDTSQRATAPPVRAAVTDDVLKEQPSGVEETSPTRSRDEVTARFVNLRINRLGQALQTQKVSLAEHVKTEVFDFTSNKENPPLPDQLYEHLMLALLSLRKPAAAIDVWNHFVGLGRQPTAKTYTVMMRGAQNVRDVNGVEAFWVKMRRDGVQPDTHAWSTRIFGLIKGGKVDVGLRALNDLGAEWIAAAQAKQAAGTPPQKRQGRRGTNVQPELPSPAEAAATFRGDVDGVPKPSLVCMNAAISALASRNDQHIPKVLAWGRTFGLEPDQTTYNVLLNVTMRHGRAEEAIQILKRMADRGIEVDSTTWTILLSALFEGRVLDGLTADQQQERIMSFITSLETATAVSIDQKGYALVIDRLLKHYSNSPAASAVLTHMTAKGVHPTAHIYTILMTSYFDQSPTPDFAAAETLWRQIQTSNNGRGTPLDGIFYDRMIEGYALHHHTLGTLQPLLYFLNHLTSTGQRPSWRALHAAARAFAEREDWSRLVQLVDQARQWVHAEGAEMVVGQRMYGQRDFWAFVIETGVLGAEQGVRVPEDVMRVGKGESPVVRRLGGVA